MYTQPTKVHQKLISFPEPIYSRLQKRVNKVGISFSEYIRLVMIEHLSHPEPLEEIEVLDDATCKRVAGSMEDFKNGRFVTLKTPQEIEDHFNKL